MKIIRFHELKTSSWKNGGGITREVMISPSDATLAELNFTWRLSLAEVKSSGPFSIFEEYERQLLVWKGEGLKLNNQILSPFEILHFGGGEKIFATPLSETVFDFGIIFNSTKIRCELKELSMQEKFSCDGENNFLFCADGSFVYADQELISGDLIFFDLNEKVDQICCAKNSKIFLLKLSFIL